MKTGDARLNLCFVRGSIEVNGKLSEHWVDHTFSLTSGSLTFFLPSLCMQRDNVSRPHMLASRYSFSFLIYLIVLKRLTLKRYSLILGLYAAQKKEVKNR